VGNLLKKNSASAARQRTFWKMPKMPMNKTLNWGRVISSGPAKKKRSWQSWSMNIRSHSEGGGDFSHGQKKRSLSPRPRRGKRLRCPRRTSELYVSDEEGRRAALARRKSDGERGEERIPVPSVWESVKPILPSAPPKEEPKSGTLPCQSQRRSKEGEPLLLALKRKTKGFEIWRCQGCSPPHEEPSRYSS
jgi:hypothetical protein